MPKTIDRFQAEIEKNEARLSQEHRKEQRPFVPPIRSRRLRGDHAAKIPSDTRYAAFRRPHG